MIDFSKPLNIAYTCPSYRRPYCRTAHYLPKTRIYVDNKEAAEYRKANEGYGVVVECPDGIQGNLPRVRNYILDTEFRTNGADVVAMMDDDVNHVGLFKPNLETKFGYERIKLDETTMDWFVTYGSQLCEDLGFGYWEVNYNQDKMNYHHYMPFRFNLPKIGQFMVFTKDNLRFDEKLPLKEDYDMAIQQMNKYRGALLICFAYVDADFGELSGGTAIRRNTEREVEQFKAFRRKWGSDIVYGVHTYSKANHDGETKEFVSRYDFSHPNIRIPIDGV